MPVKMWKGLKYSFLTGPNLILLDLRKKPYLQVILNTFVNLCNWEIVVFHHRQLSGFNPRHSHISKGS